MNNKLKELLDAKKPKKVEYKYSKTVRAFFSGITLALVASLCIGTVMYMDESTRGIIRQNQEQGLKAKLRALLPLEQYDKSVKFTCYTIKKSRNVGHNQKLFVASRDLEILGYVMTYSTSLGYSDPLVMMAGFDKDKKVYKADIYFSQETPGLGDRVDRAHGNFLDQLNGKGLNDAKWDVKKHGGDFDFITGSTVTSRATVIATGKALKELERLDIGSLSRCKVN